MITTIKEYIKMRKENFDLHFSIKSLSQYLISTGKVKFSPNEKAMDWCYNRGIGYNSYVAGIASYIFQLEEEIEKLKTTPEKIVFSNKLSPELIEKIKKEYKDIRNCSGIPILTFSDDIIISDTPNGEIKKNDE